MTDLGPLLARFQRLNRREKSLAGLVFIALLWALGDGFFLRPTQLRMQQARQLLGDAETAALQADALLQTLQTASAVDPDAELKRRLVGLRDEQATLKQSIAELQSNLILPEQMVDTLRQVTQND